MTDQYPRHADGSSKFNTAAVVVAGLVLGAGFAGLSYEMSKQPTQQEADGSAQPDATTAAAIAPSAADCAGSVIMPTQTNPDFASKPTHTFRFDSSKGTKPSLADWHYDQNPEVPGWNDEAQAYTGPDGDNATIEGCALTIQAQREQYTYPGGKTYNYTSARLIGNFTMVNGKIIVRAKLPDAKGAWPALWLYSHNEPYTQHATDEQWATDENLPKLNGEIDFGEAYPSLNPKVIEGSVHTYNKSYEQSVRVPDYGQAFHDYGAEITPKGITLTIDGKAYFTVPKPANANVQQWPFGRTDNPMHFLANLAVGGTGGGDIDGSQIDKKEMRILGIDVYALAA